ncbi:hypothetical protein [Pleionea sediminis]|uniref:hypothetical protein n=1 Tax=Pleionea sediminis TaxID=2569479 RepID=UPI001184B890|nr:hypothetical protein [Pleionea sediminis]
MIKIGLALSFIIAASVSASETDKLTDPTRPYINLTTQVQKESTDKEAPKKKVNQLKAIIRDEFNYKAIIDTKTVAVGDRINGYRVHQIKENKVILRKGSQYKTLSLVKRVKVTKAKG